MKKVLKDSFQILRNNSIFIQPLLLYILLTITALPFIISPNTYQIPKLTLFVSILLLTIAFASGWLNINKLGVKDYNENDSVEIITEKSIKNFKTFFIGVGEYFFKLLFAGIFYFAFFMASAFLITKVCLNTFGEPTILMNLQQIVQEATTSADLFNYLNSISPDDKLIFTQWILTISVFSLFLNFIAILYGAILIFEQRNVISSFLLTFKFLFKNFFNCIKIIAFMFLIYMALNIISLLLGTSTFAFVILTIMITLYINYYIILLFRFYDETTKTNSNNRTEFIG